MRFAPVYILADSELPAGYRAAINSVPPGQKLASISGREEIRLAGPFSTAVSLGDA